MSEDIEHRATFEKPGPIISEHMLDVPLLEENGKVYVGLTEEEQDEKEILNHENKATQSDQK